MAICCGRLLWLKIDNQPLQIFETDSRSFRVGTHAHGYLLRSLKPFDPTIYVQNWKEGKCFNPCLGLRLNMWCCYHSKFVADLGGNGGEMLDDEGE